MASAYTFHNGVYQHVILEGSSYEVGAAQGKLLKDMPQVGGAVRDEEVDPRAYGFGTIADLEQAYDALCPGISAELQGAADALGVPVARLAFYADSFCNPPGCAQMVALPTITADGHTYVGRSYELGLADAELRLCTTRIPGKRSHIGFSGALFGRWDGMNSEGLSVTSSAGTAAGLPHEWVRTRGFSTWIAVRAILEGCSTVAEALEMLQDAPTDYVNIIVAERGGRAALVEIAASRRAVREIAADDPAPYLIATNHYTLDKMRECNVFEPVIGHSTPRYRAIEASIQESIPHVTADTFRSVLTREFPDGCFCPYYQYWLGTLRAMILDLDAGEAEICFGAPGYNEWHRLGLEGDPGVTSYPAVFAQKG